VNGEKWAEMSDDWSLVFTKTVWFTGVASVSSEDRGKSYGLKVFLSQGKRPGTRKPLCAISPVAARLYAFPNSSPILVYSDNSPWVWKEPFFQFPGSRMFSGATWKLYPRVAFSDYCEVGGKRCQHDSIELK
jgi:hypothetical protein